MESTSIQILRSRWALVEIPERQLQPLWSKSQQPQGPFVASDRMSVPTASRNRIARATAFPHCGNSGWIERMAASGRTFSSAGQRAALRREAPLLSATTPLAQKLPRHRRPDPEVLHGALQLLVAEQELDGAQVARLLADMRRLSPSHRMCAVTLGIKADARHPPFDDPAILPRRQVRLCVHAARKQVIPFTEPATSNPCSDGLPCLIGQFELHWSAGLPLNNDRPVANPPGNRNISN